MAVSGGVVEVFKGGGPDPTYTTSAAVTGGKMVEITGNRRVAHAAAASAKVVGVAKETASAAEDKIAVASDGVWRLTAAGAIAAGDRVECAAAGAVRTLAAGRPVGVALEAIADTALGLVMVTL